MEELGLKPCNIRYLKENQLTKEANFFRRSGFKKIENEDVPDGFYRYRVRHYDNECDLSKEIEKKILPYCYSDVLCDRKIDYLEAGNEILLHKEDA